MEADIIIIGLGAMGSAAAASLSRRGSRVLGFEQFWPAHDRGASHGQTRTIRQAYLMDDPSYVPLLLEVYPMWRELEEETGTELFEQNGSVTVAPESNGTISAQVAKAKKYGIPHEVLSAAQVAERWPTMQLGEGEMAFYEPGAGFVRPEATVAAQHSVASKHGADLRFETKVLGWEADNEGVTVRTADGEYRAKHLVITAGGWSPQMLADLSLPLAVERRLQVWLKPTARPEEFALGHHPCFVWEDTAGVQFYGLPMMPGDDSVKVAISAFSQEGMATDPDHLERRVLPGEIEALTNFAADRMPTLNGEADRTLPCMYTITPDQDFVIGTHPTHTNVSIAAGFSGHGFKFVPLVGEILADLALDGTTERDIHAFDPQRFASVAHDTKLQGSTAP